MLRGGMFRSDRQRGEEGGGGEQRGTGRRIEEGWWREGRRDLGLRNECGVKGGGLGVLVRGGQSERQAGWRRREQRRKRHRQRNCTGLLTERDGDKKMQRVATTKSAFDQTGRDPPQLSDHQSATIARRRLGEMG
ncbi:unnamed protein product [Pleuronectes platessa]|uniref:Uncharacterized protein n=1 Tax=Pleuronectes platessa TaxID=8262 RepID=A0A9N7YHN3_PLEPL|nr:unnamed protein product [Pleuronectes platessa]